MLCCAVLELVWPYACNYVTRSDMQVNEHSKKEILLPIGVSIVHPLARHPHQHIAALSCWASVKAAQYNICHDICLHQVTSPLLGVFVQTKLWTCPAGCLDQKHQADRRCLVLAQGAGWLPACPYLRGIVSCGWVSETCHQASHGKMPQSFANLCCWAQVGIDTWPMDAMLDCLGILCRSTVTSNV